MMASLGLNVLALPLPSSSRAQVGQVPGMNCAMPSAPAGLTACGFQPLSCWIWAAISGAVTPEHTWPPLSTHGTSSGRGTAVVLRLPLPHPASARGELVPWAPAQIARPMSTLSAVPPAMTPAAAAALALTGAPGASVGAPSLGALRVPRRLVPRWLVLGWRPFHEGADVAPEEPPVPAEPLPLDLPAGGHAAHDRFGEPQDSGDFRGGHHLGVSRQPVGGLGPCFALCALVGHGDGV